jgi:hypothetical protein
MIKQIRRTWLPTKLPEMAAWYVNFALKFTEFYHVLGFTAADDTFVQNDNAAVQWLNGAFEVNDSNAAALRSFRDQTLYAGRNDLPPTTPSMNLPPPPPNNFTTSIIQRLDTLKEKIELAENYTPDIGLQLGIVPAKREALAPVTVKPLLKVFPAEGNYDFAVVLDGRGKSDLNDLQVRVPNQEKFTSLLRFTGKSGNAQFKPEPEGQPVKVELRIQLYKLNEKYGQPSDAVYVTLNP